jgi:hypothetical protein
MAAYPKFYLGVPAQDLHQLLVGFGINIACLASLTGFGQGIKERRMEKD